LEWGWARYRPARPCSTSRTSPPSVCSARPSAHQQRFARRRREYSGALCSNVCDGGGGGVGREGGCVCQRWRRRVTRPNLHGLRWARLARTAEALGGGCDFRCNGCRQVLHIERFEHSSTESSPSKVEQGGKTSRCAFAHSRCRFPPRLTPRVGRRTTCDEGSPTALSPWSRAALLLTITRLAQAQEVGAFHTSPASTTICTAAGVTLRSCWLTHAPPYASQGDRPPGPRARGVPTAGCVRDGAGCLREKRGERMP
jgi:hypothetical protein